jgi:hypothetical protein
MVHKAKARTDKEKSPAQPSNVILLPWDAQSRRWPMTGMLMGGGGTGVFTSGRYGGCQDSPYW